MRVHIIETGRVQIKASQIVGRGHGLARRIAPLFDAEWSDWLPIDAYAIEHRDGVILVDTGVSAGVKGLPHWHPYFRFCVRFDTEPEEEAGPQLKALGIGSADVTRVLLTHLHIDHDGGLGAFPSSEILVSPGELERAAGAAGRLRGYLPQRWPKAFDPKPLILDDGPYGPFPRSKRLTADGAIVAVATPGHTRDHLSVIVEDHDKTVFIAGDASYSEETMLKGTIDGVSDNENRAAATLTAIRAFVEARPAVYLPAHDPEATQRLAERRVVSSRQSITACAAASSRETGAADFVERMSASSGKAQSATKVMNRKLLE
jgi:glyoxylase-like metal-dependent hydrolase (beta-lactamase superfamily II)